MDIWYLQVFGRLVKSREVLVLEYWQCPLLKKLKPEFPEAARKGRIFTSFLVGGRNGREFDSRS